MTMVFTYAKSPCATDRLDVEIRASPLITVAMATGTSLLGANQLTVSFRADLPDDLTGAASVTCQTAALDAVVAAHGGVPLTIPPQNVTAIITSIDNRAAVVSPDGSASTVINTRVIGHSFSGTDFSSSQWVKTLTGTGSTSVVNSIARLSTGTTALSSAAAIFYRRARYISGQSNWFRGLIRLAGGVQTDNTRRFGAYNSTSGFFFEVTGSTLYCVSRIGSVDTRVSVLNGIAPTLDALGREYIISWNEMNAWFYQDRNLIHTMSGAAAPLVDTLHFPINLECFNLNASTVNVVLEAINVTINRYGALSSTNTWTTLNSAFTSIVMKNTPGYLDEFHITKACNTGGTYTLYDNTGASGTVIATIDGSTTRSLAFELEFCNGLAMSASNVTTAGGITVVYD